MWHYVLGPVLLLQLIHTALTVQPGPGSLSSILGIDLAYAQNSTNAGQKAAETRSETIRVILNGVPLNVPKAYLLNPQFASTRTDLSEPGLAIGFEWPTRLPAGKSATQMEREFSPDATERKTRVVRVTQFRFAPFTGPAAPKDRFDRIVRTWRGINGPFREYEMGGFALYSEISTGAHYAKYVGRPDVHTYISLYGNTRHGQPPPRLDRFSAFDATIEVAQPIASYRLMATGKLLPEFPDLLRAIEELVNDWRK